MKRLKVKQPTKATPRVLQMKIAEPAWPGLKPGVPERETAGAGPHHSRVPKKPHD